MKLLNSAKVFDTSQGQLLAYVTENEDEDGFVISLRIMGLSGQTVQASIGGWECEDTLARPFNASMKLPPIERRKWFRSCLILARRCSHDHHKNNANRSNHNSIKRNSRSGGGVNWEVTDIWMASFQGPSLKPAMEKGGLAVFSQSDGWSITHVGTGLRVAFYNGGSIDDALKVADYILERGDCSFDGPDGFKNQYPNLPLVVNDALKKFPSLEQRTVKLKPTEKKSARNMAAQVLEKREAAA